LICIAYIVLLAGIWPSEVKSRKNVWSRKQNFRFL